MKTKPHTAPESESTQDWIDRLYAEQRARINEQQRKAARREREAARG